MYRRPKFLEVLHEIREEMSREADYDVYLFVEMVRSEKNFNVEIDMVLEDKPNNSSRIKKTKL